MRRALTYLAVALVAVLAWWGLQPSYSEADTKEARSDSTWRNVLNREHALIEDARIQRRRVAELGAERDSLRESARAAAARRPATVSAIVAHHVDPSDTAIAVVVTAAVEEAIDSVETYRVSPLLLANAKADQQLAAKDTIISGLSSLNIDLRSAAGAARSEARAWKDAAHPKVLGIAVSPRAAFVTGLIIGLAAAVVGH